MNKIKVLIVDDNQEIREYFTTIFNHEEDIEVVATAATGHDAVKLSSELDIDIILMDIQMETRTAGIEAAEQILKVCPTKKIIILTILEDDNLLFQAYCAGVMDYIIKTDSITQILNSIRDVYNNQLILRPKYAEKIIDELVRVREQQKSLLFSLDILTKLSNSEFEVLKCLYSGMNTREISDARYVSIATIKTQIHSILAKFGMHNVKEVLKKLEEVNFSQIIKNTEDKL